MTLEELGKSVKAKYPVYNNIPDAQLAIKVLHKYPVYLGKLDKPSIAEAKNVGLGDVLKEVPGAIVQTVIGTPAKFITSTIEVPKTIATGKATQKEYKLPGLQPFKSYQSEQETRVGKIVENQEPLWKSLTPFLEVPLAGLETAVTISGAVSAIKGGVKTAKAVTTAISEGNKQKAFNELVDYVMPSLNKKKTIQAFEKAGKPGGVKTEGLLKKITVQPTQKDINVAKSVQGIVNPKVNPVENLTSVNNEIARISQNEIRPVLERNPLKVNIDSLGKSLSKIEPPAIMKTDNVLENTYNLVKQRIVQTIQEANPKNAAELWDSRIAIDKMMDDQFGPKLWDPDKNFAIKSAYLDMRQAINKIIADNLAKKEGVEFVNQMQKLTNMFSARYNVAEGVYKFMETNALNRFLKMHPTTSKIVGGAVGGSAIGILGSKLLRK